MQISKEVHKFLIAALFALGIIQFEEREPVRRPSYIQYLFLGRRKKSLKVFSLNPFTISLIVRIILMELSECLSPGVIIGHLFCLFFPPPLDSFISISYTTIKAKFMSRRLSYSFLLKDHLSFLFPMYNIYRVRIFWP